MPATTTKFNVGGTVFEVAVSTIQSQPGGLLAKMIDGRFPCGKDESGAFFVDWNPQFFNIVLDVHRDNKVYPLSPGVTRERVLAELEFYGLQDFEAVPMNRSVEDSLRILVDVAPQLFQWQQEQERLGLTMLDEAFARLLIGRAEFVKDPRSVTLETKPIKFTELPGANSGMIHAYVFHSEVAEVFAQYNMKATVSQKAVQKGVIKLEPAEPAAGA
ncbi:hypothetical protein T484DRAFT_1815653 [Baffinella frigidus]|nr:hypothetical protein T484DRAFT_1815653 [Cryptophyta sp. CCMP2293]